MFKMGCSMARKILTPGSGGGGSSSANASNSDQRNQAADRQLIGGQRANKQHAGGEQQASSGRPKQGEELNDFSKLEDDPRLPLNVRQIFKITKSWKAIARTMSKTGTAMFLNLFEENQEIFYLFDRFQHLKGKDLHDSMELREHAATVMSTLDQSINLLSNYDNFISYLHSIGKLHRKVPGFKREHFWKIEQPFLKAVKQTLDERCNETIEEIYKIAIKLIIETIAVGYGQDDDSAMSGAGARPGGDGGNEGTGGNSNNHGGSGGDGGDNKEFKATNGAADNGSKGAPSAGAAPGASSRGRQNCAFIERNKQNHSNKPNNGNGSGNSERVPVFISSMVAATSELGGAGEDYTDLRNDNGYGRPSGLQKASTTCISGGGRVDRTSAGMQILPPTQTKSGTIQPEDGGANEGNGSGCDKIELSGLNLTCAQLVELTTNLIEQVDCEQRRAAANGGGLPGNSLRDTLVGLQKRQQQGPLSSVVEQAGGTAECKFGSIANRADIASSLSCTLTEKTTTQSVPKVNQCEAAKDEEETPDNHQGSGLAIGFKLWHDKSEAGKTTVRRISSKALLPPRDECLLNALPSESGRVGDSRERYHHNDRGAPPPPPPASLTGDDNRRQQSYGAEAAGPASERPIESSSLAPSHELSGARHGQQIDRGTKRTSKNDSPPYHHHHHHHYRDNQQHIDVRVCPPIGVGACPFAATNGPQPVAEGSRKEHCLRQNQRANNREEQLTISTGSPVPLLGGNSNNETVRRPRQVSGASSSCSATQSSVQSPILALRSNVATQQPSSTTPKSTYSKPPAAAAAVGTTTVGMNDHIEPTVRDASFCNGTTNHWPALKRRTNKFQSFVAHWTERPSNYLSRRRLKLRIARLRGETVQSLQQEQQQRPPQPSQPTELPAPEAMGPGELKCCLGPRSQKIGRNDHYSGNVTTATPTVATIGNRTITATVAEAEVADNTSGDYGLSSNISSRNNARKTSNLTKALHKGHELVASKLAQQEAHKSPSGDLGDFVRMLMLINKLILTLNSSTTITSTTATFAYPTASSTLY